MSDDKSTRRTPPENDDDWLHIWRTVDRSSKMWIVVGPIHAVVSNWKALLVIAGVILAINSPRIIAVIEALAGTP